MPNMNMEVIVSFVDRLSGPAREAAESLNKIKTSAEGLSTIGEHFTSAATRHRAIPTSAGVAIERAVEELERAADIIARHAVLLDGSAGCRPLR